MRCKRGLLAPDNQFGHLWNFPKLIKFQLQLHHARRILLRGPSGGCRVSIRGSIKHLRKCWYQHVPTNKNQRFHESHNQNLTEPPSLGSLLVQYGSKCESPGKKCAGRFGNKIIRFLDAQFSHLPKCCVKLHECYPNAEQLNPSVSNCSISISKPQDWRAVIFLCEAS